MEGENVTPTSGDLPPYATALLNTIAGPESGGKYDVIYGGSRFNDFSDHPRKAVRISSGPNTGKTSSAAGKYQFLGSTWDDQAKKLGLTDFSPASQDKAAWNLAKESYARATGGDLDAVLQSGDPQAIAQVGRVLNPIWTSLPGGIEAGTNTNRFVSAFNSNLGSGNSAASAIEEIAPSAYVDPMVVNVSGETADQPTELAPIQATAEMQPDDAWEGLRSPFVPRDIRQALVDRSGFVPGGTAQGEGMERARRGNPNSPFIPRDMRAEQPQQVAQVQQPATAGQTGQYGIEELYGLIGNKFLPEEYRAQARAMLEMRLQEMQSQREEQTWRARQEYTRQQQEQDPLRQLQIRKAQRELEEGKQQPLINAGSGSIYDPNKKEWLRPPDGNTSGAFRFSGNSVEAQALNGLMESGQLTPDQAQQIAAGKTITGPNGEIIFMTPQGVFGQQQGGEPQRLSGSRPADGIDIFGDGSGTGNAVTPTADTNRGNGMIPLTEPKVTIDEKKAMTFADRMRASGKIISEHGAVGASIKDALASQLPFGVGNFAVSDEYQSVEQARRDFINAQLRRESGAVISQEEFDNANKQYFPQPGDTEDVIKQKERSRQRVIDGMARDAGPTYGNNSGAEDPLGIR
ncbi:hypothetical protein DEM27_05675 [Metarhizobium album]|uniref:Uncharacterized protein n=2 Tax=Metarhizobium album TaxID=2182425 RepID=A0A2U2DW83_9HYPH|nr:hypothetical protein DEM27_05675 [Rhizobium album]